MGWTRFAFLTLIIAAPVSAEQIDNAQSFDLAVKGSIPQHCSMGSIANIDFGNLERKGLRAETPVAFNCNVPFNMRIKSANGLLKSVLLVGAGRAGLLAAREIQNRGDVGLDPQHLGPPG